MEISQYFNIKISSPKEAEKQVSIDATKYVDVGAKLVDEDGLIKEFRFDMKDAYLMMDILSIGMRVDVIGGDLSNKEFLFSGFIKDLEPLFTSDGDVYLKIVAFSLEGSKLGIGIKNLVYPSKTHPKPWATKELTYSEIIVNMAEDSGIRVRPQNITVKKDIKAGFSKGSIKQSNMTDWAFMQMLARKIHCTLWTVEKEGIPELFLVDDSSVVSRLAGYTFFFLARINAREGSHGSHFIDYNKTSDKQIQIQDARIILDSQKNKGAFKVTTDSNTGKTRVTTEQETDGISENWVLDEEKLRGLSSEERKRLISLFASGKIVWESKDGGVSAKDYFKKEIINDSSREGEANSTEVVVSGGGLKSDGVGSTNPSKEVTGSKTYKTVIDEDKLKNLSSEKRSGIMGRIARREMTDEDRKYYKVVDTTPKHTDTSKPKAPLATTPTAPLEASKDKKKRDAGFKIDCKIFGNLNIKGKMSYVLEGLGKYSDKYYLYRIEYEWGTNGFIMNLTFTK